MVVTAYKTGEYIIEPTKYLPGRFVIDMATSALGASGNDVRVSGGILPFDSGKIVLRHLIVHHTATTSGCPQWLKPLLCVHPDTSMTLPPYITDELDDSYMWDLMAPISPVMKDQILIYLQSLPATATNDRLYFTLMGEIL